MTPGKPAAWERLDWRKLKFIAVWVFAVGLAAHGYCYFNANFSHDSLFSIYEEGPEMMISMGRYLRPVYRLLRGNFTLPVINGLLSLTYLTATAYLLTSLLNIRSRVFVALACCVLTVNSTVSLMNASYLHDADAYALSLLLAVLGVWAALRLRHGSLIATVFYFASLGLYQAYINVAVYVFLILALGELLEGQRVRQVYGRVLKGFLPIAAAMILYFIGAKVILAVTQVAENTDPTHLSALQGFSLQAIPERLRTLAVSEILWFFQPMAHAQKAVAVVNVLLLVLGVARGIAVARRRRLSAASVWGILGVAAAIPFGMNAVTLISNTCHYLTMYAFNLSYLCVMALAELGAETVGDKKPARLGRYACAALTAVLVFDGCLFSNECYLKKELESQATLSTFTRIVDRMEQTPGYVPGQTPVVFTGRLLDSPLSQERAGFNYQGTGLWHSFSTTYPQTLEAYFQYYLGYPAVFVDSSRIEEYEQMEQVIGMHPFPAADSVQMVDGVLVVKLSDPAEEDS